MAEPLFLECVDCGNKQSFVALKPTVCESCGGSWVEAHYDYEAFKRELLRGLPGKPFNLWRYIDVLPVNKAQSADLDNSGGTPLYVSKRFGPYLNCSRIYVKDERYGPTSSFKDRQAVVSVTQMVECGVNETVIASTGNAAVAYAAACARAGIKLWVFMTSMVPSEKLREVALYGAEVIKVSGTYDQTKQIAAEFAKRRNLILDRGARSLAARESMKTIAYEIVEQLGWRAPDYYVQAVSGGLGPLGVYHGFQELLDMGLINQIPKLIVIQAEGCAPMVNAFKAGRSTAEPVVPETRIAILSTGDPGSTYTYLWKIAEKYGGIFESVKDSEAFETMRTLAKYDGLAVEPATAVAFAGLEKLVKSGQIDKDALVVINCTGHTFPVEKHVLGEQWKVDVALNEDEQSLYLREGLQAALERLDESATTVLIIDDNEDDAKLIRRILEAQKPYRVFNAHDGWDGLAQARQRLPDLIISDLMMPGLDGFGVLEELRLDRRTQHIPIIIISAKDITLQERERLNGYIKAIYQKGSLTPRSLVNQVVEVLENKTANKGES